MLKAILALFMLQLVLGAISWVVLEPLWEAPRPPNDVQLLGPRLGNIHLSLKIDDLSISYAPEGFEIVAQERLGERVELRTPTGGRYAYRWSDVGGEVVSAHDEGALEVLIDRGFLMRVGVLSLRGGREAPARFALKGRRARALLKTLARVTDRAPISSRWDFSRGRPTSHRVGYQVDVEASLERLLEAFERGDESVDLVVHVETPSATIEAVERDFKPTHQMALFRTSFKTRKRNRSHNLKLASRAIEGTILMPGELFSYNETVGERSAKRGYKEAPVIVRGEIIEGMGGGACQVSSTLHAASLFGGLQITARANHSLPSSYIDRGLDAVVSWPNLDLKLRNTYDFPIALHTHIKEGRMIAEIWGPFPADRVVVRREVTEKLPFRAKVEVVEGYEPGKIRTVRQGRYGYKVKRARILWRDGKEHFEALPLDTYQARPQLIKIGPGTPYPPQEEPLEGSVDDLVPDP